MLILEIVLCLIAYIAIGSIVGGYFMALLGTIDADFDAIFVGIFWPAVPVVLIIHYLSKIGLFFGQRRSARLEEKATLNRIRVLELKKIEQDLEISLNEVEESISNDQQYSQPISYLKQRNHF